MSKVMSKKIPLVLDTETTNKNPHKARLLGTAIYANSQSFYSNNIYTPQDDSYIIAHNGKYDSILYKGRIKIDFDTLIAQYILHIDKPKKLEKVIEQYFNEYKHDLQTVYNLATNKERKNLPDKWWEEIPEETLAKYAKADVEATYRIYEKQSEEFKKKPELYKWFTDVEIPLLNILVQSELKGVKINRQYLKDLEIKFTNTKLELEKQLQWLSDSKDINLNSSQQIQNILYKKFNLPKLKKTKTGISTDHKTLEKLAVKHIFPRLLLQLRESTKLLNTFIVPLQEQADGNDRVHATYNQCGTLTRRMSCSEPNLQQIPAKTDNGKLIRDAFIPEEGHKFLIADYDQIELRLLAHFSEDPVLLDIYNRQDGDIHAETMKALGLKRTEAKIFNFSLVYGKTAFGLAQDFNCSQTEAQELIDKWFNQFPKVKDHIELQHLKVYTNKGWTESLAGLPLYCGDPYTKNKSEYHHIMRKAVNYPIQASSQDILKKAIIGIYNRTKEVPVLMVHDELVYEVSSNSSWRNHALIMEQAWQLKVPLKVSWKISDRWEK